MVKALLEAQGQHKYELLPMCRFTESKAARRFTKEYPSLPLRSWQEHSQEDLEACFQGCFGVFVQTDTYAFPLKTRKEWTRSEIELAHRILRAAQKCKVQHITYSSLPSIFDATNGAHNIRHFEAKNHIAKLFKESDIPTTIVSSGPFFTNIFTPQYSYYSGDTFILSTPANPQKLCGWVDPSQDIGQVVRTAFERGLTDEEIKVCGPQISFADLARTFTCVTGFKARYVQCSAEEFKARVCEDSAFQEDLDALGQWLASMPGDKSLYGTEGKASIVKCEKELGVKFSNWEEYLRRAKWLRPTKQVEFEKSVMKPPTIKVSIKVRAT